MHANHNLKNKKFGKGVLKPPLVALQLLGSD